MKILKLPTPEPASTQEIRAALAALTEADRVRLLKVARILSKHSKYDSPEDLISEAVFRAWQGCRVWPKDRVEFVRFIIESMRSICSAWRRSLFVTRTDRFRALRAIDDDDFDLIQLLPDPGPPHEEEVMLSEEDEIREREARELRDETHEHFKNDPEVLWLIQQLEDHYLSDGEHPSKERGGLSKKQYATIRKRLRRGLARLQRRRIP